MVSGSPALGELGSVSLGFDFLGGGTSQMDSISSSSSLSLGFSSFVGFGFSD